MKQATLAKVIIDYLDLPHFKVIYEDVFFPFPTKQEIHIKTTLLKDYYDAIQLATTHQVKATLDVTSLNNTLTYEESLIMDEYSDIYNSARDFTTFVEDECYNYNYYTGGEN